MDQGLADGLFFVEKRWIISTATQATPLLLQSQAGFYVLLTDRFVLVRIATSELPQMVTLPMVFPSAQIDERFRAVDIIAVGTVLFNGE